MEEKLEISKPGPKTKLFESTKHVLTEVDMSQLRQYFIHDKKHGIAQGWRGRQARPAPGLALVLTSGQFCLVFKVVIQRKNGQMSKIGWNFKVGLALEKLPAPPL